MESALLSTEGRPPPPLGYAYSQRPRPWKCTKRADAIFCPLHGDCRCRKTRDGDRDTSACAMHREGSTHPNDERLVR